MGHWLKHAGTFNRASRVTRGEPNSTASGQADAVLFIRALHNLARFEDEGNFLTTALNEAYRVLKPCGIIGVVP